jgi:hypothetical protein
MQHLLRWSRSLAAVVIGYAVIVALTTLVFREFDGLEYHRSSTGKLILGGAFISAAGFVGGYVAAWLAGRAPFAHGAAVVIFLIVDTSVVISRGPRDPLWFTLLSAFGLMAATVFGGALRWWVARTRRAAGLS